MTTCNANPFALTFAFAPSHTSNASKVKRECKPTHETLLTCNDTAFNVNRLGQSISKIDTTHLRTDRRATDNSGFALWGLTCFVETFVQGSTSLLRMNNSAKNPPQRKAANRYQQP